MSQSKRFVVTNNHTLIPHWFLNNKSKREISVTACHLSVNGILEKGFTLESNITHSEPYVNGFVCYINEFFSIKTYNYSDEQMYTIDIKIMDTDDTVINLDEVVSGVRKYRLKLELLLSISG